MTAFFAETKRSLGAALALARRDVSALDRFDLTESGFWHSFAAAFIVLPMAALYIIAKRHIWLQTEPSVPLPNAFVQSLIEIFAFALDWALLPILMIFITRRLGLTQRYVPFVVAWNWSNVIAALFALPPVLLLLFGLARPQEALFLNVVATALVVYYQQRVAQVALAIPMLAALAFPLLDLLLGVGLELGANAIERAIAPPHI